MKQLKAAKKTQLQQQMEIQTNWKQYLEDFEDNIYTWEDIETGDIIIQVVGPAIWNNYKAVVINNLTREIDIKVKVNLDLVADQMEELIYNKRLRPHLHKIMCKKNGEEMFSLQEIKEEIEMERN